jgi:hypothetical protein
VKFLVAREFGLLPWELDEAPTDLVFQTLRLMEYFPREI